MAELTPERLTELRRIAEAATPGPWRMHDLDDSDVTAYITSAALPPIMPDLATVRFADDARYIAAFDPTTVLALLDRIEALEHKVVEHKVVSQRLALHRLQDAHNRLLWELRAGGREWEHCPPKERCEKCGFDPRLLSTLADRLGGVNDAAHKLWTTIGNVRADLLDAAWHMAWRRQRDDEGERSC